MQRIFQMRYQIATGWCNTATGWCWFLFPCLESSGARLWRVFARGELWHVRVEPNKWQFFTVCSTFSLSLPACRDKQGACCTRWRQPGRVQTFLTTQRLPGFAYNILITWSLLLHIFEYVYVYICYTICLISIHLLQPSLIHLLHSTCSAVLLHTATTSCSLHCPHGASLLFYFVDMLATLMNRCCGYLPCL